MYFERMGCQLINLHSPPSPPAPKLEPPCRLMPLLLPCTCALGTRGVKDVEDSGGWRVCGCVGVVWHDMFLYKCPACTLQTKGPPCHFLPHFLSSHFLSSPCCVLSVSLCLSISNHRPDTVWVSEGSGSTLPPLQASVQLGKDYPLLW